MRCVVLILTFFIIGCGPHLELNGFESYVEQFEKDSQNEGVPVTVHNLIIKFDNSISPRLGECEYSFGSTPIIRINKKTWDISSSLRRELIMYHELGHCILKRPHIDGITSDGIPISIMTQPMPPVYSYRPNREYYIRELLIVRRR